jgi:putative transposase
MPRPLRPEIAGELYHVTCFGAEERKLFPNDATCKHFLHLLEEAISTYGIEIHGFVLLDDSYRLLVKTRTANLKQFMHRLNVGYTVGLNRQSESGGAAFGERMRIILVEPGENLLRLSRHLHLAPIQEHLVNPTTLNSVRVQFFTEESVQLRLRTLREYRWSSYRAYAGYIAGPEWLRRDLVLGAVAVASGEWDMSPEKSYRTYVEQAARIGLKEDILNAVKKRLFLGDEEFVARMKGTLEKHAREGGSLSSKARIDWDRIVKAVEKVRGRRWDEFINEYGDSGRDLALYAARKLGGYTLREAGERVGGMGITAVGQAVTRFERQLAKDLTLRKQFTILQERLLAKE